MNYYQSGGEKKGIIKMKENNKKLLSYVWKLSVPAILTQIATIVMQYIDSAMVGSLGENASAAIGLVSTTTWLLGGIISAISVGFSVQIAHAFGAQDYQKGRVTLRYGLIFSILFSIVLLLISVFITKPLPMWLKANESIWKDASLYFFVYAVTIPFTMLNTLTASSLQCSGNMVIPSILNAVMCLLDVIFNAIFIPKYQVLGAGIGTGLATVITSFLMFYFCCFRKNNMNITIKDKISFQGIIIKKAIIISIPIAIEQIARSFAMIVSTSIVAPLGNTAIAANSFAVTAEGLCYMLGFGVASAATTLVGQEMGANNFKKAKAYSNISIMFGTLLMTGISIIMFIICPYIFMLLTPSIEVRALSTKVLRLGLFAEPLYGASIVATGALRGAEDTLVPSILNLLTIWLIRIPLSYVFVTGLGLLGIWLANSIELCIRGIVMLIRQKQTKHYDHALKTKQANFA